MNLILVKNISVIYECSSGMVNAAVCLHALTACMHQHHLTYLLIYAYLMLVILR